MTLRYSPHADTPTATTVAVTKCGVLLLSCKSIFFGSILHLAVHGRSDTLCRYIYGGGSGIIVTMGCSDLSNIEANLVSVILLVLLKDCSPWKT
jgi:hypothetical protein